MSDFITALLVSVNATALWGEIENAAPFIGVVVLIAFGYRIVRRLVSGVSKGKAKF